MKHNRISKSKRRSPQTVANKEAKLLRQEAKQERRRPWNQNRAAKHAAEVPLRRAARRAREEQAKKTAEAIQAAKNKALKPLTLEAVLPKEAVNHFEA